MRSYFASRTRGGPPRAAILAASLVVAACSSDGDALVASSSGASTGAPTSTSAAAPPPTTTARPGATSSTTSSGAAVRAGATSITVSSTAAQYFVLFVKPDLSAALELPVAIARGADGSTTLTDGRSQLPAAHYRVATYSVASPQDVDGDGIDDLTELADPAANALNPAPRLDPRNGAVIVPDVKTFGDLSYQGNDVARDSYLAGLEFVKFWIVGTNTAHPAVYFMNTNTFRAHPEFASVVGIPAGRGPTAGTMRGDIVYNADAVAPDGSKGTYRFAFQPNDAFSFREIAIAYEMLVSSMPMLRNNLLYYPFPQSALPLYQKEKAQYDAYRIPVLLS